MYNSVPDESLLQITLSSLASVICGICEVCGYLLSSVFGFKDRGRFACGYTEVAFLLPEQPNKLFLDILLRHLHIGFDRVEDR